MAPAVVSVSGGAPYPIAATPRWPTAASLAQPPPPPPQSSDRTLNGGKSTGGDARTTRVSAALPSSALRTAASWGGVRALCPGTEPSILHAVTSEGAVVAWDLRKMFRPAMAATRVPSPVAMWDALSAVGGGGVAAGVRVQSAFFNPSAPSLLSIVCSDGRVLVADVMDGTIECVAAPPSLTARAAPSTLESIEVLPGAGCFLSSSPGVMCIPQRLTTMYTPVPASGGGGGGAGRLGGGPRTSYYLGGEGVIEHPHGSAEATSPVVSHRLAFIPTYRLSLCSGDSGGGYHHSAARPYAIRMQQRRQPESSASASLSASARLSNRHSSSSSAASPTAKHPPPFRGSSHFIKLDYPPSSGGVSATAPHPAAAFSMACGLEDGDVVLVAAWPGEGETGSSSCL